MVVFFESGRLGNQIFQYATLKMLFPNEKVILFGFEDLDNVINPVDVMLIKRVDMPSWVPFSMVRLLFSVFARFRLIGSIWEKRNKESYEILERSGIIFGVKLLQYSYFQHSKVIEKLHPEFSIRDCYTQEAKAWVLRNVTDNNKCTLVFVHVRRGDYLTWPSRDYPAVLDLDWYLRAMERIRDNVNNPLFIMLTDDVYYVRDAFPKQPDLIISDNNQQVDFALMSLCSHGILSASSFSWWGAWLSRRVQQEKNIYFAPMYWCGHRCNQWMPEGFVSGWITYVK